MKSLSTKSRSQPYYAKRGSIETCKVCPEKYYCKGYCQKHYTEYKLERNKKDGYICIIEGCDEGIRAKDLCTLHYNRLISQTRHRTDLVRRYTELRSQAKKKGRVMELSFEDFSVIASKNCYYCDDVVVTKGSGIDRLDSKTGYTIDNSVSCCWECNRIKGNSLTVEETKLVIKTLRKFRKEKK